MRNRDYEPIWLSMAKHREEVQERKAQREYQELLGKDELPF